MDEVKLQRINVNELDDLMMAQENNLAEQLPLDDYTLIDNPPSETKFIPKIKSEEVKARPLFKSNFERYEWHLKNGCICSEDRKWFEKYITSEEYKLIYEAQ